MSGSGYDAWPTFGANFIDHDVGFSESAAWQGVTILIAAGIYMSLREGAVIRSS